MGHPNHQWLASRGNGGLAAVDRELPVVKPPILAFLEEIRSPIVPLQGGVDSTVKKVLSILSTIM